MKPLCPGDRAYMISPKTGRKLRGIVPDYLMMSVRHEAGENALVPFQRRKTVIWVRRGDLRKLPPKAHKEGKAPRPCLSPLKRFIAETEERYRKGDITLIEAVKLINQFQQPKEKTLV